MGYVLLWIEDLVVGLLVVATLVACFGRLQRRRLQVVLSVVAVLMLWTICAGLTGYAACFKYYHMVLGPFHQLLALTAAFTVGAVWILWRGLRRRGEDPAPAAATWPRGKLAVVLGVGIALYLVTFWNVDLAVKQRLATLRVEAGMLGLSVAPARLSDREDAARDYERAFVAMGKKPNNIEVWDEPWQKAWGQQWEQWREALETELDPQDPELRRFLELHAPALALLRQAAAKPRCYFDRDYARLGYFTPVPELPTIRDAARLLAMDARCKAADGNTRGALEDVAAIFGIAEHVSSDPILVALLVAIAIDRIAADTLQVVLVSGQVPPEELALLRLDQGVSYHRLLEHAFRGAEAARLSFFCQMDGQPDSHAHLFEHGELAPYQVVIYRVFLLRDDLASSRRFSGKLRDLVAQPYYQARDGLEAFEDEFQTAPKGILTALFMPALARAAEIVARGDARRGVALLGLAMCRYRAAHDRFPDELAELAPEFLTVVPSDPFDGQPMKLKQTEGGPVVYSVGPNLTDDGGAPFDRETRTGDIRFVLSK